jgi:hypothetical protein
MNTIILIDTDSEFARRLRSKLDEEDLQEKYQFQLITPVTTLETREMTEGCILEVNEKIFSEPNVIGIFVDVVIVEGQRKGDTTGIAIATELRRHFPNLPIFCITGKYSDEGSESDVMSDATLEDLDGVFSKGYLEGKYFSAKRLRLIFEKARAKRNRLETSNRPVVSLSLPERIKDLYGIDSLDARVESQIQELGPNEFWSLLTKLLPQSQGIVSFMRPGRSGAYVFRVLSKFISEGGSVTQPKSWALKVSTNSGELEKELTNYKELIKTPLPRTFYPKAFGTEVVKVGNLAGFAVELEENTVSLMDTFQLLPDKSIQTLISGISRYIRDTYGEPKKKLVKPWKEFYKLNRSAVIGISSTLFEFSNLFKEFDEPKYEKILKIVKAGGLAEAFADEEANSDLRIIHGDFNARNLLIDSNHNLIIIDFASRCQSHVVKDIAKLERDVVFRIHDSGSKAYYDWSRVEHWKKFLQLNQKNDFFSDKIPGSGTDPDLDKCSLFIVNLRAALKSESPQTSEREYLMGLLHYSLLALSHPEISIQKKVFAIQYIDSLLHSLS